jgi:hypothetical protein
MFGGLGVISPSVHHVHQRPRDPLYAGDRYPAALISYAVWLYFGFPLSLRFGVAPTARPVHPKGPGSIQAMQARRC